MARLRNFVSFCLFSPTLTDSLSTPTNVGIICSSFVLVVGGDTNVAYLNITAKVVVARERHIFGRTEEELVPPDGALFGDRIIRSIKPKKFVFKIIFAT